MTGPADTGSKGQRLRTMQQLVALLLVLLCAYPGLGEDRPCNTKYGNTGLCVELVDCVDPNVLTAFGRNSMMPTKKRRRWYECGGSLKDNKPKVCCRLNYVLGHRGVCISPMGTIASCETLDTCMKANILPGPSERMQTKQIQDMEAAKCGPRGETPTVCCPLNRIDQVVKSLDVHCVAANGAVGDCVRAEECHQAAKWLHGEGFRDVAFVSTCSGAVHERVVCCYHTNTRQPFVYEEAA